MNGKAVAKAGISFGTALAMVISYVTYGKVLLAAFHGLLGWLYVIYHVIKFGFG